MKITQKIVSFLVLTAAVLAGCERDYDAPPLDEPVYTGAPANITIAELKANCINATQDQPEVITNDWILRAYISGNDESGNIYKQVILQDETGAMPIQVDESNVCNFYRRGQQVFVVLKGLCVSVYGEQQQLGDPNGGSAYRLAMSDFKAHVQKDGWPSADNVKPEVITDISTVNLDVDRMTYRLVQLEGVHFENGGKATFAKVETNQYGEENLKDAHGNVIMVRTSNYASFAAEKLPVGTGTVVGILGRFKGTWQISIPARSDVFGFDGIAPEEGGGSEGGETGETVLFKETFGNPNKVDGYWPYLKDFSGLDNNVQLFTGDMDKLSARAQSGDGCVWFPAGEWTLSVGPIQLNGAKKLTLIYKVGANVYNAGEQQSVNALSVKCGDTELSVPGDMLTTSDGKEVQIENIEVSGESVTLTFKTTADNTLGTRLFDVKLVAPGTGNGGGDVMKPEPNNVK